MSKKVTFAQQYEISKWTPKKSEEFKKTNRFERIDTRKEVIPIEEELVIKHETDYELNIREKQCASYSYIKGTNCKC